jgi:predicted RNA-binding protein with PUA-like domain
VAAHYLLKTEPSDYSFADLARDRETIWDGVSNPAALLNLRSMSPGDLLVIYETGNVKSAVGAASVITVHEADAKEPTVKIKAAKPLPRAVPLSQIKANELFADSPLVRQGRLSVVPLTPEQYRYMVGGRGPAK